MVMHMDLTGVTVVLVAVVVMILMVVSILEYDGSLCCQSREVTLKAITIDKAFG